MSEKTTARSASENAPSRTRSAERNPSSAPSPATAPFFGLQQNLGNQAMLQLLEAGVLQAKLRVSQPGDADEIEADRVAEKIVSRQHAPVVQRKCSCGGDTPCSKCAGEDEEKIHRSVATPMLRSPESVIQRSPADPSTAATQTGPGAEPETPAKPTKPPAQVVVDDEAKTVAPHQMRKSQFIAVLRAEACTAADAILASVGHTTKSCPYIEKWLGFYEKQSSQHIEQALHKYAPETAGARNAHEAIRLAVKRVQRAALTWAKTGKVQGVPSELAGQFPGGGLLGGIQSAASSGVGGAILGFFSGQKKKDDSGTGSVMRKARNGVQAPAHDAAAVKSQLGSGHSLDSRVQSQMSSAFGHDFSSVRVHTDSHAASLSSDLQARAFAIGNDVAFAPGEYKPGTLIGDALIAHELAHVVQQGASAPGAAPMMKGGNDYNALEQDADRSAVGAIASVWAQARGGMRNPGRNLLPNLKSGLRLSRCKDETGGLERLKVCVRPVRIAEDDGRNPTTLPSFASAQAIWGKCCVDVSIGSGTTIAKTAYKTLDDPGVGSTPSAEERKLFTDAGGGGGCISVFVPENFNDGTTVGKDVSGGGVGYDGGSADPKVVVVEGIDPTLVAHEMGHAMGYLSHDPAGTVMEATNAHDRPTKDKVASSICDKVRTFSGASATGKKDCKESI
jgi:hypothetical protein